MLSWAEDWEQGSNEDYHQIVDDSLCSSSLLTRRLIANRGEIACRVSQSTGTVVPGT